MIVILCESKGCMRQGFFNLNKKVYCHEHYQLKCHKCDIDDSDPFMFEDV
jgi:hypothetical protein